MRGLVWDPPKYLHSKKIFKKNLKNILHYKFRKKTSNFILSYKFGHSEIFLRKRKALPKEKEIIVVLFIIILIYIIYSIYTLYAHTRNRIYSVCV